MSAGAGDFPEGLAGHAEMIALAHGIVPFVLEARRIGFEKVAEESHAVVGVVGRMLENGIERPDPGVFVVIDIVAKLVEAEQIMKIIPGHAAEWELPDQSAHDDAKFLA